MGYRSDVCMRIEFENAEQLLKAMQKLVEFEMEADKQAIVKGWNGCDVMIVQWLSVKWYDDFYSDVKEIMEWFKGLENDCKGAHYMRIGEDYTDLEEIVIGEPYDYISLNRSFDIPNSLE